MVEKEIAEISIIILLFTLIVYFSLLFYTLGDKPLTYYNPQDNPLIELNNKN